MKTLRDSIGHSQVLNVFVSKIELIMIKYRIKTSINLNNIVSDHLLPFKGTLGERTT